MSVIKKAAVRFLMCVFAMTMFTGCGGISEDSSGGQERVLKVASSVDFAPFEFEDETRKEYQGFDMDLIRALCREMGCKAEIINIGFDGLIPALESKRADLVISGMTINEERKQRILFSDPYYQTGLTMVIRSGETGIQSFRDLEGRKIAVQVSTTSFDAAKGIPGAEVKEMHTPIDCLMELKAGGVDAVINDRPVNDYYIMKSGAIGVKVLPEVLTVENYGIAAAKGNRELIRDVNRAMKKLRESGEYDKIYSKWFGEKT